jgi:trigger factor
MPEKTRLQAFDYLRLIERTNMQVTVEDVSSVKKILHIEIPAAKITAELDSAYIDLKKNAKIKGFRPGKAPRAVLERQYGKDVNSDITSRLIQETFVDALKETGLKVIGSPFIDPPEITLSEPYKYQALVEIRPEISDVEIKGLKLKKTLYEVDVEVLNKQLQMLQKNMTEYRAIEENRGALSDDFLLLNYEGFKNGAPFAAAQKTENFTMKLGNGNISKDFDDQIIGMTAGETKEFMVNFPADYRNKDLAGQEILFKVTLNEIRKEVLPPIDDELAKKMGPFGSLDELKNSIRENLTKGYEKRTEQELNEQIFTNLIEKSTFEVPDTLIDFEMDHIIADTERSFSQQNISMQDLGLTREVMAEKYRPVAEKQARRHLILSKVIEQEKIEATEEETDNEIRMMAETYQQPFESLKQYFTSQPDRLAFFKDTLLEKKALKLILENSEIEEIAPEKIENPVNADNA